MKIDLSRIYIRCSTFEEFSSIIGSLGYLRMVWNNTWEGLSVGSQYNRYAYNMYKENTCVFYCSEKVSFGNDCVDYTDYQVCESRGYKPISCNDFLQWVNDYRNVKKHTDRAISFLDFANLLSNN